MINFKKIGIDEHILYTLVYRGWNIFAGALVVFIVPYFFSGSVQGYYFTFSSLVASQVFFELGLNYVITQIIAHEAINVSVDTRGGIYGEERSVDRIISLLALVKKWYLIISILFLLIVSACGFSFFYDKGDLPLQTWAPAWFFHVFFTSVNLFISPYFSILDGLGKVANSAKIRLLQSLVSYLAFAVLAVMGMGLYSVVAISFGSSIIGLTWLLLRYPSLFFKAKNTISHYISWRHEIFPFQWKIAISWISGYFIFQLFNPLMFAHQGPVVAGQMGLSMSVFSTLLGLAMGWVTAKSPVFAGFISSGDRRRAVNLFSDVLLKSSILNIILGGGFVVFVIALNFFDFKITSRLLPVMDLILILCTTVINQLIFSMAAYMRAHKEEPMLLNSVCVALITIISLYFTSFYGATTVLIFYLALLALLALPWTYLLFKRYLK